MSKLWLARVFISNPFKGVGEVRLTCRGIAVAKETPTRWYLDCKDVEERALLGPRSFIKKSSQHNDFMKCPTFHATEERFVLNMLLAHSQASVAKLRTRLDGESKKFLGLKKYVELKEHEFKEAKP